MLIIHALIKGDPAIKINKLTKKLIVINAQRILQNENNGVWKAEKITKARGYKLGSYDMRSLRVRWATSKSEKLIIKFHFILESA